MNNTRISLGPVFVYEWITSTRRWQAYALRSLFVSALLLALVGIWKNTDRRIYLSTIRYLAELGEGYFLAVIGTQLTLVLLAAPAATAGTICVDRARGTLSHMLMTDLSAAEIVLGKLAARLVPVLSLLACTLPVLELVSLLGGVDPSALLGGFVVTIGVAVLGCSLAMTLSLWVGKTHEALLCTYAIWCLWLLAGPMIGLLSATIGWPWMTPPRRSEPFFLALAPYWWPGSVRWWDYLLFLGVTCSISAVLIGVAIMRLRSNCARESARQARRLRSAARGGNIGRALIQTIPWLTPSLDGNPVAWREWRRSRPSRWMMLITLVYGGMSVLFSILAVLFRGGQAGAIVNGLQVAIGLLLLSVTAATSLAEERARGSLDLLMSTPVSTWQIVVGKWLGAFRLVPLLAILPAVVIWAENYVADTRRWYQAPLMIAFVLCAGAAITSLGLAMATRFSQVGRAVGTTVAVYVLVTVGWVALAGLLFGRQAQRLVVASPMIWPLFVTNEAERFRPQRAEEVFWIIFYGLSSAAILLTTLTSFDRRLGRIDDVATWACLPSRLLRIITAIYFAGAFSFIFLVYLPANEPDFLAFGSALLLSLGTLVLAVRASWPLAGDRVLEPGGPQAMSPHLIRRILVAKWVSAGRLVPGVIIFPMMAAFFARGLHSDDWPSLVILLVYMLCVSFLAVSLGVAIFALCRRKLWAVVITVAVWLIANTSWFGNIGLTDPRNLAFSLSDPFSGVTTLTLWMNGAGMAGFPLLAWAIAASVIYAALAGLLFLAARAARHSPNAVTTEYAASRQPGPLTTDKA